MPGPDRLLTHYYSNYLITDQFLDFSQRLMCPGPFNFAQYL